MGQPDPEIFSVPILSQAGTNCIRILLKVPSTYTFAAGQYLTVHHADGIEIPMSIASSPLMLPNLELHFQPTQGDPTSEAMDQCLQHSKLNISKASGWVRCPPLNESLTVVAGGSGASLAFCCVQHRAQQLAQQPAQQLASERSVNTQVLWCVDANEDFYDIDVLEDGCNLYRIVDPSKTATNAGLKLLPSLAASSAYIISGSPGFVYAVTEVLENAGVPSSKLQSDVYDYAPREAFLRNTAPDG